MHPSTTATVRPDLAIAMMENAMDRSDFMGLEILTPVGFDEKSGTYGKLEATEMKKKPSSNKREPSSKYNRVERKVTTGTYTCEEYGQEEPIDDGDKRNIEKWFDAELDAAMLAEYNTFLEQEQRIAELIWSTSTFTADYQQGVSAVWSSSTNGKPVKDVAAAKLKLKNNLRGLPRGRAQLVLALPEINYNHLIDTNDFKNRFNYVGGLQREAQKAAVAACLGVDEVVTSAAKDFDDSDIWDDAYGLLALRSASRQWKSEPRLGNVMRWDKDCPENALVETYREENIRSDIVRVRQHVDEIVLNVRCGILITGVTS